jgi:hypothetical protein
MITSMGIDVLRAEGAGIGYAGRIGIESMVREGRVVLCNADRQTQDFEKLLVEFESQYLAINFEAAVKDWTASIILEEDTSINAAPKEIQQEWEVALVAGNQEALEALRKELWEDFGIHAPDEPAPVRETSGIKRLAIMHDHGVNAFGFKGREQELRKWMDQNGFNPSDAHHYNLDMWD